MSSPILADVDRAEIEANWADQLQGMDDGDTALLERQFTRDAVLVHMTGVRQGIDSWMTGIRRGDFVYHRIEEHERRVELDGDSAVLVGHITTGITDDGTGQAWPLRCEQHFVRTADGWLCRESRVTFDR